MKAIVNANTLFTPWQLALLGDVIQSETGLSGPRNVNQ